MSLKTRAQEDMKKALNLVSSLEGENEEVKNIYGGLCHNFPILVRQSGLCQALAFSADKATGDGNRARAHQKLLEHVAAILGQNDALGAVQGADAIGYMHYTRRVLSAWVYFKRFAASVLGVHTGGHDESQQT
ncbi:type III-B CRISPR module-associated protein Cmr5 [Meiothermus sp. CFH 77666]|uniref:type III-B CRISPR module-associated protein Cmr5 n=1 Tax=Meiothermus sp. CFH 77666 TaxID=2817942 RepID=UPI001AA0AE37|nr:type III-B CRISPR module-associated protein Cmr5 [Meiothermus sp. CFH 77666]MBO1437223.1 type III-B CRISPR module-associated protein Cmr5 [Meiothermus sp. CFH 77666]